MNVNISKYTFRFALVYIVTLILAGIIMTYLDMDKGSSGIQVVITMIAGMQVAAKFIKDHKRVPTKSEKHALVWGSFGYSMIVSCIGVALIYFGSNPAEQAELVQIVKKVPTGLFAGIFAFIAGIHVLMLYFSYGRLARNLLIAQEKHEQKNKAL